METLTKKQKMDLRKQLRALAKEMEHEPERPIELTENQKRELQESAKALLLLETPNLGARQAETPKEVEPKFFNDMAWAKGWRIGYYTPPSKPMNCPDEYQGWDREDFHNGVIDGMKARDQLEPWPASAYNEESIPQTEAA